MAALLCRSGFTYRAHYFTVLSFMLRSYRKVVTLKEKGIGYDGVCI